MSHPFDPDERAVIVSVWLTGLRQTVRGSFRVDTGADRTVVRAEYLRLVGYPVEAAGPRVRIRSATGAADGRSVVVSHVLALDRLRTDFPMVAHDFPPTVTTDGLLGLDFFRSHVLAIDFIRNRVSLDLPRPWRPPWG